MDTGLSPGSVSGWDSGGGEDSFLVEGISSDEDEEEEGDAKRACQAGRSVAAVGWSWFSSMVWWWVNGEGEKG